MLPGRQQQAPPALRRRADWHLLGKIGLYTPKRQEAQGKSGSSRGKNSLKHCPVFLSLFPLLFSLLTEIVPVRMLADRQLVFEQDNVRQFTFLR
jgi:hypothetical protein